MTDHPMTGGPAAPSTLARAAAMMLDDLAELRRREDAVDRRLRGIRLRIEALMVPLAASIGALEPHERDSPRARLARLDARYGPRPRRLGGTPASEALLGFLARARADTVTVAEAQAHLARTGLAPRPRYAALSLGRLAGLGIVTRTGFATYAVHSYHPELVARRLPPAPGKDEISPDEISPGDPAPDEIEPEADAPHGPEP